MTPPTLVLLLVSVSPLTLQKIYFSIFFFLFWLHMFSCAMTKHHQSWFLERGSQWRSSSSSSPRAQHGVKRLKTFSLWPLSEGSPSPINILKAKLPACFGAQSPLGPPQLATSGQSCIHTTWRHRVKNKHVNNRVSFYAILS